MPPGRGEAGFPLGQGETPPPAVPTSLADPAWGRHGPGYSVAHVGPLWGSGEVWCSHLLASLHLDGGLPVAITIGNVCLLSWRDHVMCMQGMLLPREPTGVTCPHQPCPRHPEPPWWGWAPQFPCCPLPTLPSEQGFLLCTVCALGALWVVVSPRLVTCPL